MIDHPAFRVRALVGRRDELHLDLLAQTESVFALSNGHIGLRGNLDEGEPHGLPGTYLNSFYELRPLPYAGAGVRRPGGRPDASSTSPTASSSGCWSTTSRSTSATASCATTSGSWTCGPARWTGGRVGLARDRTVRVRSTRLVSFTQRAIAAIWYEVEAVGPEVQLVVQSELVANEELPASERDPRRRRPSTTRWSAKAGARRPMVACCWSTAPRASGLRVAATMDHEVLEAPTDRELGRASGRPGPGQRDRHAARRGQGCGSSSSSPTAGPASARCPRCEDQVAAALSRPATPVSTGLLAAQRALPRRLLGPRRRRGRGRRRGPAGGALRAVPGAAGRRPRRAAGDPGQGPDRPGLRRPRLLGHRDVRPAGADLHPAGGRGRRPPLAPLDPSGRHRAGPAARPGGAAFPWRTIHGEECSGYWPAGTAAFHINADIADAVDPLPVGHRRRRVRRAGRRGAAGGDGPAVVSLGHHDAAAGSASTA